LRALIFGGAGFIGSNLVRNLLLSGHEDLFVCDNMSMGNNLGDLESKVKLSVGDMLSVDWVTDVLHDFKPDRIYHLAANSDISSSAINPILDVENTLISSINLASALRNQPVEELVFASSSAVYGESEGLISENSAKIPVSAYGWMKLASEEVLFRVAQETRITKYLCVRFPNVTGQNQTHGVVFDLVRKLRNNPLRLQVLGDGSQLKPYAVASELVQVILRIMGADWSGQKTLNIGPKDRASVREIVEIILEVSGLKPEVSFDDTRSGWNGDVPEYMFDCTEAETLIGALGFKPSKQAVRDSVLLEWQRGYAD
jgi:UDP-glucose 4-epimerase